MLTLFAGLVLNFSKIFWDCVLEARAAMITDVRKVVDCDLELWRSGRDGLLFACDGGGSWPDCDLAMAALQIGTSSFHELPHR
jgi:hypothetical protein